MNYIIRDFRREHIMSHPTKTNKQFDFFDVYDYNIKGKAKYTYKINYTLCNDIKAYNCFGMNVGIEAKNIISANVFIAKINMYKPDFNEISKAFLKIDDNNVYAQWKTIAYMYFKDYFDIDYVKFLIKFYKGI